MTTHPRLADQLSQFGVTRTGPAPDAKTWHAFLRRVSQSYVDADCSLHASKAETHGLASKLRSDGERMQAILHSLGDGLCALDPEGRVLFMNPQAELLLGWSEDELVGRDLLRIVGVADRPVEEHVSLRTLVADERTYHNDDALFVRKDGVRLPVMLTLAPLITGHEFSGAVLVFRDMTPRQRRLAAQAQVVRRESLLRLAQRLAAESDPEQALTDLLTEAVAVVDGRDGLLTRWDALREVLVPLRNTMPLAEADAIVAHGATVSARAIESRAPVWINQSDQEKAPGPASSARVRAVIAVPLLNEGRLMGALSVNTHDPETLFTQEDAECLELLAGLASGVLATMERAAELAEVNRELRQSRDEAQHQALHDSLTGLPNRTLFADRLQQGILVADRERSGLALLIMDLDRFKDVNDTLGHPSGDDLLQQVGVRLRGVLRASDTVARMGGDEFAAIVPADAMFASQIAAKLVRALEQSFTVAGQVVSIGASVGIALYPQHGADAKTLLRHADTAMYVAKRAGSGTAIYSAERDGIKPDRLVMTSDLRSGIQRDELVLHYQPTINLRTDQCDRVEALVRWQHPQRGLIAPDQFIPFAEETGLIKPLAHWVLRSAIRQCKAWNDDGLHIAVAVNLSMRNLHDPELIEEVAHLLAEFELQPAALKIEVTESTLMSEPRRALDSLMRLRAIGVEVAIDDFGTGHASLSHLKRMPVEEIKLDRSFIKDMRTDKKDFTIVRSTIELAHNLGLRVVAEGVEDQATWDLLVDLKCDLAQGYHMSRPLTEGALRAWLAVHDGVLTAMAARPAA